tara:strand:- start:183059 stop:184462 length:1404 start_codon:yes stop_codon:yes gene_type:complete
MKEEQYRNLIDKVVEHFLQAESIHLEPPLSRSDIAGLFDYDLDDNSPSGQSEIQKFCENYLRHSVNTSNRSYCNQLWSKVESPSFLGEMLSAATNTSMYTFEVAPVATILEHKMIDHFSKKIWGEPTEGLMTSGGTASNLQALMMARNHFLEGAKQGGVSGKNGIILTSKLSHYSIKRSANILGIGIDNCLDINPDSKGKMNLTHLKQTIDEQIEKGNRPFCVVATAGTTVHGAYDPIDEIADICKENDIWLHVDGAYGANALLSAQHRHLLKGVEKADSISWDFHKAMGIHLTCAFLLTRHKNLLKSTLVAGNDKYLFHDDADLYEDLGPRSLQCGRRVDILKLWLTWMSRGRKGMADRVDQLFQSSIQFAKMIEEHRQLELLLSPESTNICFRYISSMGPDIRHEEAIRQKLMRSGEGYINFSSDDRGPFFRMAITRPDLDAEFLANLLKRIIQMGEDLDRVPRQ